MEAPWLAYAKRLHAVSHAGLLFCRNEFDRERYEEMAELARQMLADLSQTTVPAITAHLDQPVARYPTPMIDVRGAMIEEGKVLLVQERADGAWSLPGGFAEVGRSASENVVKEVFEEAGLKVTAPRLYALRHKAKHPYDPDLREFYKVFFLCQRADRSPLRPGHDVAAAGFFPPDALPRLSRGRVIEVDILSAFAHQSDPTRPPDLD